MGAAALWVLMGALCLDVCHAAWSTEMPLCLDLGIARGVSSWVASHFLITLGGYTQVPVFLQEAEGATVKSQKLTVRLAEAQAAQSAAEQRCSKLEIRFARSSGGAAQLRALQLEDECSGLRQQLLEVQAMQEQQVSAPASAFRLPAGRSGAGCRRRVVEGQSSGRAASKLLLKLRAANSP